MRRFWASLILLCFIKSLSSQNFARPGDWKKYRKEVFVLAGAANFLGDLGGLDKIGTHYSPVDLDFPVTKSAFGLGYRYKLQKWLNWTSQFQYAFVRGDDALTKEPFRNNRNLNFKSNIIELATRIEIGIQTNKAGNRYGIKRTLTRRMKNNNQCFYIFGGIGGFHYNPKGRTPNGAWVALRPLHTEGQGLPGGPKQYSKFSLCIPVGAYYKVTINKQWTFGAEISWRKTFTDYIDDVSGVYYDSLALATAYGALSAQMADPSLGTIPGATKHNADGTGAQRGDKQVDSYITLQLTAGYIFKQKRKRARLRSKF